MNKTLCALMTKLQWQLTELDQQLQILEQQRDVMKEQLRENQNSITRASAIPACILPEKEIARLHFMIGESQKQDELITIQAELLSQKNQVISRQIRLNTELKMLEKHQNNQLVQKQRQAVLLEQNNSDEWVLQQRELA